MQSDFLRLIKLRKKKILRLLRGRNLDGAILSRIENVRYVSGFRPVMSSWFRDAYIAILRADGSLTLLVTSGDYERARRLMPWVDSFVMLVTSRKVQLISEVIQKEFRGSPRIGYDSLEATDLAKLKEMNPHLEFVFIQSDISNVRAVKLPEEIKVIELGAKITEKAVELAIKKAKPGIRECELAALAEREARSSGAEAVSWSFATFSGEHAGLMYRYDSTKIIKRGEFLILGYASTYEGYNTDITATTVVGHLPTRRQKAAFKAVYEAYTTALASATAGASTKEISGNAASVIDKNGIDVKYSFVSFQPLIHGLGMNVYEPPFSPDPGSDQPNYVLEEGNVFAIEPAVAFFDKPSLGGVRIGETITIGTRGLEILGRIPEGIISEFSLN